ncbi:MAG: hypothetical protein ACTSX7_00490 [Alphaproteobacteria bacterium]
MMVSANQSGRGEGDAWQSPSTQLNQASLGALLAGEIPAIRLADFATADECSRLCGAIADAADLVTAAQTSPMNLIGCNFSNHAGLTKADYFAQVAPSYRDVGALLSAAGFEPLDRMLAHLRDIWPERVSIAAEPGFERYFAGGIKTRTSGSRLHYDFTPHTASDYVIGSIRDQLGWNLYLDLPQHTGHTIAYNRAVPRHGAALGSGPARGLGIDPGWVEGAESFTFRPAVGEVVIINTRYPHEVIVEGLAAGEWRVQISSFIGRLANDELILWS